MLSPHFGSFCPYDKNRGLICTVRQKCQECMIYQEHQGIVLAETQKPQKTHDMER